MVMGLKENMLGCRKEGVVQVDNDTGRAVHFWGPALHWMGTYRPSVVADFRNPSYLARL